jgi:phosphomannomutase
MAHPSSPFKSYDIRGLVGIEIDPPFAEKLACALAEVVRPKTALVGFDMRESSPVFAERLIRVLRAKGIDCLDIGLCTTTVFYAALTQNPEVDLGVMITASHNPSAYNGFKLCRKQAVPIGFGSGMEGIRDAFVTNEQEYSSFVNSIPSTDASLAGTCQKVETALERYLSAVVEQLPDRGVALKALPPRSLKIVIDAGNGMAGFSLPALCERFPALEVIPLYWELDGTFPNHEANPLNVSTLAELQKRVVTEGALAGFAFDGDGDRIGVVDETGEIVPGDMLTALLAKELLPSAPDALVFYDLRCSWSVPETIREAGGRAELCRVGHAHIKKQMREAGALFAGELSMHFYFSQFANCEASEYALLLFLGLLQKSNQPLSALWKPLRRYHHSGEKNYHLVEPAASVLDRIRSTYAAQASAVSMIDGLRYEFRDPAQPEKDWWFSVRTSNTEPLIRLNLEAHTKEVMQEKIAELECAIIGENGAAPSTHEHGSTR